MENPEIYNPESLINYSEGYTEGPNLEEIPADAEIIPDAPEEDTWKPAQMYKVKDYPIVKRIINKTLPDYKRHDFYISEAKKITISGTYWSGGSRESYLAVNLDTGQKAHAPQFNPPHFGGPAEDPKVLIPNNFLVINYGYFCGKVARIHIYTSAENIKKLLIKE